MTRSAPLLSAVALALCLLTGCANDAAPARNPASTNGAVPEPADRTVTATPGAGDTPLAGVDPCGLVSADHANALSLSGGTAKTLGQARVCRWRHEGRTLADSFTVSVEIFDALGLADIVGTQVEPKTIGSHPAMSFIAPTGSCGVSLGVGDSSRVDLMAVGGKSELACQLATRLAGRVEPELP